MVQELISTTTDNRALVASQVSNIDNETAKKRSTGYSGIHTDITSPRRTVGIVGPKSESCSIALILVQRAQNAGL